MASAPAAELGTGLLAGHALGAAPDADVVQLGVSLLVPTPNAGTSSASQAFWAVRDLPREVAELKARGVTFEQYDLPGLTFRNGIAFGPDGKPQAAWFKDTEGNILALIQQ